MSDFARRHYPNSAILLRGYFNDALDKIEAGTVDILHVDGLHTYEAVKYDFESWQQKLSDRAVVLFHDTNIFTRGFGVHQLWAELQERYPTFDFKHSAGLGVLAYGKNVSADVLALCSLDLTATEITRRNFEYLSKVSNDLGSIKRDALAADTDGKNIALHCRAYQSSHKITAAPTPQGAVNGIVSGSFGFHTDHEAEPWWKVDLGKVEQVDLIRVFNRLDPMCRDRARTLKVLGSSDGEEWTELYRHSGVAFGGADGNPLVLTVDKKMRYVKLALAEPNFLHLDEVQVIQRS